MQVRRSRLRLRFATVLGDVAGWSSRRWVGGAVSVISGRVIEASRPTALAQQLEGRTIAVVSGTNGKSTTTALLAAAMRAGGPVATNDKGSNMPAGIVAALSHVPGDATAVLEVDEGYVPALLGAAEVDVLLLLNLSRDQLDRVAEVRKTAERWRQAIISCPNTTVVANADDPPSCSPAASAAKAVWVAAGSNWHVDATSCPNCGARIRFELEQWHCSHCDLARPNRNGAIAADGDLVIAGDDMLDARVELAVPGRHNQTNAVMAIAAARRARCRGAHCAGRDDLDPRGRRALRVRVG